MLLLRGAILVSILLAGPAMAVIPGLLPANAWSQQAVAEMKSATFGMALDSDSRPHFAYTKGGGTGIFYSAPSVVGWREEVVAGGGAFWPDLALDRTNGPHVVFAAGPANLRATAYAHKVGSTWAVEMITTTDGGGDSRIRVDSQDRVHVVYSGFGGLKHAVRDANGWTIGLITTEGSAPFGFDLDQNGNAHVAYYPADPLIRYATNAAGGWALTTIPVSGTNPDIAVDVEGKVHVTFQSAIGHLGYAALSPSGWIVESADANPYTGRWPSIDTDAQGRPHITYGDQYGADSPLNGKTRYATKRADGSWQREIVGPIGWNGFRSELRVDAEGFPRIGYELFRTQGVTVYLQKLMLAEPLLRTIVPAGVLP